jgi:hypothetical protein
LLDEFNASSFLDLETPNLKYRTLLENFYAFPIMRVSLVMHEKLIYYFFSVSTVFIGQYVILKKIVNK